MITRLSIDSFKAISDRIDIPLKPFNVIIGRNGSGKSSAIEAIAWLSNCVSNGAESATSPFHRIEDIIHSGHQSFRVGIEYDPMDLSVGGLVEYDITIRNDNHCPIIAEENLSYPNRGEDGKRIVTTDIGREYKLALKGGISKRDRDLLRKRAKGDNLDQQIEGVLYALDALEAQEFSTAGNPNETLLKIVNQNADRGASLLRDTLNSAVFLKLNPKLIGDFSERAFTVSRRLLDEEGSQLASVLAQLDSESMNILLEKIRFVTGRVDQCDIHEPVSPADRRYFEFTENEDGHLANIPAWVLSEGTRRITAILALLLHDNPPSLLCIEEIENGLDPWTVQFMLEELSSASLGGTQVIITTHSPYLLNMIPIENVILVDRMDGNVVFTPGESLRDASPIFEHMGAGDMYTGRYLHDKAKGGDQ